jgi:hypothetical protein
MPVEKIENWNQIAETWPLKGYHNEILAEHKKKVHLNLITRWADVTIGQRILKTDLFAEAFDLEQFLFDMAQASGNIVGIDGSSKIAVWAKQSAERHGIDTIKYICCDIRQLPIQDNSVDLIISDSTLDHLQSEKQPNLPTLYILPSMDAAEVITIFYWQDPLPLQVEA